MDLIGNVQYENLSEMLQKMKQTSSDFQTTDFLYFPYREQERNHIQQ
jgi:hypothetical protein